MFPKVHVKSAADMTVLRCAYAVLSGTENASCVTGVASLAVGLYDGHKHPEISTTTSSDFAHYAVSYCCCIVTSRSIWSVSIVRRSL